MKIGKFLTGLGMVSAICVSGVLYLNSAEKKKEVISVKSEVVKDISVQPDVFRVDPEKSVALYSREGSIIKIKKGSLVYENGDPVIGDVNVSFTEYHNIIDVIKSRVKMTYDSAGTEYHLQSAGMFTISGKQGDRNVKIKEGKEVIVDLVTNSTETHFNKYEMVDGEWKFLQKDFSFTKSGESLMDIENTIEVVGREIEEIKEVMPYEPAKADPEKLNLKVDFKKDEFPELASFQDVLFEFLDDSLVHSEMEKRDWDFVEVEKGEPGIYVLKFYHNGESFAFDTKPVLANGQENGAFASLFDSYNQKLAKKQEKFEKLQTKRIKILRENEKKRLESLAEYEAQNAAKSDYQKTQETLFRSFTLSGFGTFNSDCPANLPQGPIFAAEFVPTSKKDSMKHNMVYLIEKDKKMFYSVYPNTYETFKCNLESNNMLIILSEDNKIFKAENDQFTSIASGKKHNFWMKKTELNTESELTIKAGLNF